MCQQYIGGIKVVWSFNDSSFKNKIEDYREEIYQKSGLVLNSFNQASV